MTAQSQWEQSESSVGASRRRASSLSAYTNLAGPDEKYNNSVAFNPIIQATSSHLSPRAPFPLRRRLARVANPVLRKLRPFDTRAMKPFLRALQIRARSPLDIPLRSHISRTSRCRRGRTTYTPVELRTVTVSDAPLLASRLEPLLARRLADALGGIVELAAVADRKSVV